MALLQNWDKMTEAERERAMVHGVSRRDSKKGRLGKGTEDKTKEAINGIEGACCWNSNNGTPLLDKIVCWKGRFLLVECKETISNKLPFSCIRPNEHTHLTTVETPSLNGMGIVVIRYMTSLHAPKGFVVSYSDWLTAKKVSKFKYFNLDDPPVMFRPFWWAHIPYAKEHGMKSDFEEHIDTLFRGRPLPDYCD